MKVIELKPVGEVSDEVKKKIALIKERQSKSIKRIVDEHNLELNQQKQ